MLYSLLLGVALAACWEGMLRMHEAARDPKNEGAAGTSASIKVSELVDVLTEHDDELKALREAAAKKKELEDKKAKAQKARTGAEGFVTKLQVSVLACALPHTCSSLLTYRCLPLLRRSSLASS